MFTEKRMYTALARIFGGSLSAALLVAAPAYAQSGETQKVEKVEITGSSIKRIDAETALPVAVFTREDIQRVGASTAEELLKSITVTASSGSSSAANSGAGGGQGGNASASLISLRGLGSTRTLVLVNGRRSAPSGGSPAVDINSIPVNAIERIEILKDGASAVYGSDAIAGVVNFILRKDYTGAEATVSFGAPTRSGGGSETKASVYAGFGNLGKDRYNVNVGASIQAIKPIYGRDRAFATRLNINEFNDGTSNTTFPANIRLNTGLLANPVVPNCGPYSEVSPFQPAGQCRFDNSASIAIQPESKQANLVFNGKLMLSATTEWFVDSSFNRNRFDQTEQPVLINGGVLPAGHPYIAAQLAFINSQPTAIKNLLLSTAGGVIGQAFAFLPSTSPYYPTAFANTLTSAQLIPGQPLTLLFRSFVTGVRQVRDTNDNARIVTGLRGSAMGWDYDTGFLYSKNKTQEDLTGGWVQTTPYLTLLNTGVINPFGPTTDASAVNAALATTYNGSWFTNTATLTSVDAKASRELFQLPAGTMNLALGAEFRKEKIDLKPAAANQQFLVSGFGSPGVPVAANRNVESVFAEVNVPIFKNLEGDAAVRYDNYQRVGSSVNPKISFRWQPTETVLIRAAYGTGFRAPTLVNLYQPPANGITGPSRDLIRCPLGVTGLIDCQNQFVTLGGGNPALKPERSKSQTLGFLFEPNKEFSIGIDGYVIGIKDLIQAGVFSTATILANPVTLASFIHRGPPDGNASGVGPIIGIDQGLVNIGKVNVSGIDLDIKGRVLNTADNKITLRMNGSYLARFDTQNSLTGAFASSINNPSASALGVIVRWRHTASATWERGPWVAVLTQNYQTDYGDVRGNFQPAANTTVRTVGAYETYDTQVSYVGFKSLRLALGVKNILNRDPPYANYSSVGFVGGYDLSYSDIRGRFVYSTATYAFK